MSIERSGLGSLANLAKIMEEAAKPDSEHREDRKPKPKALTLVAKPRRQVDPLRKAWHEKRLKELAKKPVSKPAEAKRSEAKSTEAPEAAKTVANKLGGVLMQTLAAAKTAKPKESEGKKAEAWRRKPGEPIF